MILLNQMHKKNFKTKAGYTIIETMIAISLFIIIVMAGMGALLNANLLHQKSRDMRSIIDNLSFVMEDMVRNLRTGHIYHCFVGSELILYATEVVPKSCASGWGIAFETATGNSDPSYYADQVLYYIDSNGKVWKSTDGGTNFFQLTPNEIFVDPATSGFSIVGAVPPPGNTQQPLAIIRLSGKITFKNISTPFSLQTTVSQRLIDI